MRLIDCFYQAGVIDCYTFVFDEQSPVTGCYTMLATSETGRVFSQWTEGMYEPSGDNSHLGERPRLIAERLVEHILGRMAPPKVVIEVLGGVAYLASQLPDVEVEIIDHDNVNETELNE